MYESEANRAVSIDTEIPADVLSRFGELRSTVAGRTLIPWGEHCTECVWPTCYTTCDLYSAREDGRCRRFVEGMVRIPAPNALNTYVLKISFKRWAKLWSMANLHMHSVPQADRAERGDLRTAALIGSIPFIPARNLLSQKRYSLKKHRVVHRHGGDAERAWFVLECFNPNAAPVSMTLTVRRDGNALQYQALLPMAPGFNRHVLPAAKIARSVDLSTPFSIDLTPNDIPDGLTLYLGAMDFLVDPTLRASDQAPAPTRAEASKSSLCKCVVWDLDNTLWSGTLVEDGPDAVTLRPGIEDILRSLDERGILISALSKNNHDDAMTVLRRFGIDEFFLHPQISWNPKSQGMRAIADALNIGIDSLLFVDDSAFERAEVGAACPEVMLLDAADYATVLDRKDCQAPVTEEGRKRRLFYREQTVRSEAQAGYKSDYFAFLHDCNLRLTIRELNDSNLDRVHELTQRTNQMNFSGNRYSRDQLIAIMRDPRLSTDVLDCEDRFGSYGTIGFSVVDRQDVRMLDLMFSCRVQSKRVEHAFVSHIVRKFRTPTAVDFFVSYRRTPKNAPSGKVFDDLGAIQIGEIDGVSDLLFPRGNTVPDDGIVTIDDQKAPSPEYVS